MKSSLGKEARRKQEKGSALFIILICVALFALLSYTVAQMFHGGNPSSINEEKAKLYADEILNYARAMRQGAQTLKISNGCADGDISVESGTVAGYEHVPPASDKCKLFSNAGGGLSYLRATSDWLDLQYAPAALRGDWFFPAKICVPGTGSAPAGAGCNSDSADNEAIIAVLPYVNRATCVALNNALGVPNPSGAPPQETGNAWLIGADKFVGTFGDGERLDQSGLQAGCFEGGMASTPPDGSYHFFQVLVAR